MKSLRQVGQFSLNRGDSMARGMYNVTNEILLEYTKNKGVSFWFDGETRDLLLRTNEADFVGRCKQMVGNGIPTFLKNDIVLNKEFKTIGVIIDVIENDNETWSYRTDSDGMREENELQKIHPCIVDEYVFLGYNVAPSTYILMDSI